MKKTLTANRPLFYNHRAMIAGETFQATPTDAQYFISRGHAQDAGVEIAVAPVAEVPAAAQAVPVVPLEAAEPFATESVMTEMLAMGDETPPIPAETDTKTIEPNDASGDVGSEVTPARRPYRRRATPGSDAA